MGYVIVSVISFLLGIAVKMLLERRKKNAMVSSTMLQAKIAECSDLTTCNLVYVDLIKYVEGSIPLLTRKAFSMIYQANIRVGINLNNANVEVTAKTVTIHIPETEVQSIDIDPASLRFYDERFAILNWNHKEDITTAIEDARKDAEEHADIVALKNQARIQAEKVIARLLAPLIDGREVIVVGFE